MSPIVLGLNCSHDASVCIAFDGEIIAAVAEERLTRIKHHAGFPRNALDYCLKEAGLDASSLDAAATVVINQLPPADFERDVCTYFPRLDPQQVIVNPSHHLLHACYAQLFLDDAAGVILVVDGSGYSYAEHARRNSPLLGAAPRYADMWESLSAYESSSTSDLRLLMKDWGEWKAMDLLRFPSFGHMYSLAAQKIFGSWTHAGKVMGLAPYGDPSRLGIRDIVQPTSQGVSIDTNWILRVGSIPSSDNYETNETACDLAALVQDELERGLMHVCKLLRTRSSASTICLTGGVALNSVFNGRLRQEALFDNAYFTPAAGDSGVAIGGAVYAHKVRTGAVPRFKGDSEFLGKEYQRHELDSAIRAVCEDLNVETCSDVLSRAAEDICDGYLVGWFEGSSEFGPRALGHRSILADPRKPHIKALLNSEVKFREAFRPYAAAVLLEHVNDWFEQDVESPHMLMVATVRPLRRSAIPAVVHYDNTCRLQTLRTDFLGGLRSIVGRFCAKTNVPLVLNTSLNIHGEPTAESPHDALEVLLRSGLNVLYMGPYRLTKKCNPSAFSLTTHIAIPAAPYALSSSHSDKTPTNDPGVARFVKQGNRRLSVTRDEALILDNLYLLNDERGCTALASITDSPDIFRAVRRLASKGVLRLKQKTKESS